MRYIKTPLNHTLPRMVLTLMVFAIAFQPQIANADHQRSRFHYQSFALADKFLRTELYFGRLKPDGATVSDEEWSKFLNDVVTPRFPAGFTVLDAIGQYRDKSGAIVKENSKVIIFLYSRKDRKMSRQKIDEIRQAYVKLFNQESVLRMDLPKTVEVYFD